jgi:hypothetical protein
MKERRWYLVGILIACVSLMDISCKEESDDKIQVDSDTECTYQMEYDHMLSYDVFAPPGESCIRQAFSEASTELDITFSDDDIPAAIWPYQELGAYYYPYMTRQIVEGVGEMLVHKSYLIAIQDASGKPPEPDGSIMTGYTIDKGKEGAATSVVFVKAIRDNHPNNQRMEYKVTIHEMGHARASLTHLCLDNNPNIMSDEHDTADCVMGQGEISTCTGLDLTVLLHFCPKCREKIKKVSW